MTRVSTLAGPSVVLLGDAAHAVTPAAGQVSWRRPHTHVARLAAWLGLGEAR